MIFIFGTLQKCLYQVKFWFLSLKKIAYDYKIKMKRNHKDIYFKTKTYLLGYHINWHTLAKRKS